MGRETPVYAYDLNGKFVFETPTLTAMANALGCRPTTISRVCNNDIPGEDNGRYTAKDHYLRFYKKDQLTQEEMFPASRIARIEEGRRKQAMSRRRHGTVK